MAETANMHSPEMRYLLGTLSEDEKVRLEEAFFADGSQFEAVEIAEDALIDAYVQDELSRKDRQQFESKLRDSPRLVERVYFARALAEKVPKLVANEDPATVPSPIPLPPPKVRWWERWLNFQPLPRLAPAAGVVLVVVGGMALITTMVRIRGESNRIAAERAALQRQTEDLDKQLSEQRIRSEQLAAEVQRLKEQRAEDLKLIENGQEAGEQKGPEDRQAPLSTFATVFLTPGTSRSGGGDPSELIIQPGTTTAQLQLALGKNDYRAFNAELSTADGTVVTRRNRLRPSFGDSGPQLLLSIPTRLLAQDSYVVHLDGVTATGQVETFNDYQFQVTKK